MTELIFATGNKGKLAEVEKIFENSHYKIISLFDLGDVPEIEETGSTFEENALIKAEAIYNLHQKPVIADDSGLAVEQLPQSITACTLTANCTSFCTVTVTTTVYGMYTCSLTWSSDMLG